jgi:hypothetical protein
MPWNETGGIVFSFLADLAAEFDDKRGAETLYEILSPAASHFVVVGFASAFWGSIARPLGLLAATLGRTDEAASHFEYALAQNARVGATPFVAQTQYDYARFLLRRGDPGDRRRSEALTSDGLETVTRLGLPRLHDRLTRMTRE